MQDANTTYLNKYMEDNRKKEEALDKFIDDIDNRLVKMQSIIKQLEKEAEYNYSYDFREDLKEILNDTLL